MNKETTMRCCVIAILLAAVGFISPTGAETVPERSSHARDIATDAYYLRMQGKVDKAVTLLKEAIATDPENADAHYELARTQFHMALGRPRELVERLDAAQASIDSAVSDSENPVHHLLAGHIAYYRGYFQLETHGAKAAKANIEQAFRAYTRAAEIKSDYREPRLYLVELNALLPEDAGGNREIAEKYATQLEEMDAVAGAHARAMLLPHDADRLQYWRGVLEEHPGSAEVLAELGRAHLYKDEFEKATARFEEAAEIDPRQSRLFLDLARCHTMAAMDARDEPNALKKALASAEAAMEAYMKSEPSPPMRAYALRVQAFIPFLRDDREQSTRLKKEAEALDPYVSQMAGVPQPELFVPPSEIAHQHRYMLRFF